MCQVRLILPIGILLFLSSASAQISVQTVAGEAQSASTYSLSLPSSTAGNLILVGVTYNSTLSSISDSQGNSLTQVGNELTSPGGARSRVYFAKNIKVVPIRSRSIFRRVQATS